MRIWKKNFGWVKPGEKKALDNLKDPATTEQQQPLTTNLEHQPLTTNLELNLEMVRQVMGNARDLIIREFTLAADDKIRAAIIALGGMAERNLVNKHVLNALMLDIRFREPMSRADLFRRIKQYGISPLSGKYCR